MHKFTKGHIVIPHGGPVRRALPSASVLAQSGRRGFFDAGYQLALGRASGEISQLGLGMLNDHKLLIESFRQRFLFVVGLPSVAVLLLMALSGFYAIHWTARRSDAAAIKEQRRVLEIAIRSVATTVAAQQRSVASGQALGSRLARGGADPLFLHENIGVPLHFQFGYGATLLRSPNGQIVFASVNGVPKPPGRLAKMGEDLGPLLAVLRSSSISSRSLASVGSDVPDGGERHLGGVVQLDGAIAIAVANDVYGDGHSEDGAGTTDSNAPEPVQSVSVLGRFTIVSLIFVDDALLNALSDRLGLADLRYVADPFATVAAGEPGLSVRGTDGKELGSILWRPELPGSQMAEMLKPMAAAGLFTVAAILGYMAWQLWVTLQRKKRILDALSASETHAHHLASHDVLTSLPNRVLLHERLGQCLAQTLPSGRKVAVLLLDLDRFKQVNDTMGHHAGDVLIREVAARLTEYVRQDDIVARLGGDEFVVILDDIDGEGTVSSRCEEILECIRQPLDLLGKRIVPGATIGVAIAPDDAVDRDELIRKADIAMYAAKADGRNDFRLFDNAMDESVRLRNTLALELRAAVQELRDLRVYYQPLVDSDCRKATGFEALVRWSHPVRGLISPGEFIAIAEETGLIVPLGEWVFRSACRTAKRWPGYYVAVNISPVQFRVRELAQRLMAIADEEQCDPACLELEITEGVLLGDDVRARDTIARLRQARFRIALDDFGTGYSSLQYLQRFPVDRIKIDQSFVQSLGTRPEGPAIVKSVVGLGRTMGLSVTAEGVETLEQMAALMATGCTEFQGYLFSAPIPESEMGRVILDVERTFHALDHAIESLRMGEAHAA